MRVTGLCLILSTMLCWSCDAPAPPVQSLPDNLATAEPLVRSAVEDAHAAAVAAPDDAAARGILALQLDANGFAGPAKTAWLALSQLSPQDPRPPYYLALQAANAGNLGMAITLMDNAIDLDPGHAPAHWHSGYWALDLGQAADATERFQRALDTDPAAAAAMVGLARARLAQDQVDSAILGLQQLQQRTDHPYVRYLLGQALRRSGKEREAAAMLASADPQAPSFPDGRQNDLLMAKQGLDAEYERADRFIADGEMNLALRSLNKALAHWPEDVNLMARVGEVHRRQGDVAAWLRQCKRAARYEPDTFGVQLNLSMALRANEQLGPALSAAKAAIELNPDVPEGYLQEARIHLLEARPEDAVIALDRAFALGVTDPKEQLQYAGVLLETGRSRDAITHGAKVAQAFPGTPVAWMILARAHHAEGELMLAFEASVAGLKANPGHQQLTELARAYQQEGLEAQQP